VIHIQASETACSIDDTGTLQTMRPGRTKKIQMFCKHACIELIRMRNMLHIYIYIHTNIHVHTHTHTQIKQKQ
jgi:hypothetical protein